MKRGALWLLITCSALAAIDLAWLITLVDDKAVKAEAAVILFGLGALFTMAVQALNRETRVSSTATRIK